MGVNSSMKKQLVNICVEIAAKNWSSRIVGRPIAKSLAWPQAPTLLGL